MQFEIFGQVWSMLDRVVETCSGFLERIVDMCMLPLSSVLGIPCMPCFLELGRCAVCCSFNWCPVVGTLTMSLYFCVLPCALIEWVILPCNPWVAMLCYPQLAGYLSEILEPCIPLCTLS